MVVKHSQAYREVSQPLFYYICFEITRINSKTLNCCYDAQKSQYFTESLSQTVSFLIVQLSLQPDRSFEAAANYRLTEEIFAVNADIKLHIIALNSHLADFFTCQDILKFHNIKNLTKYIILITFDSIWHEIGVYNR